MMKSIQTPVAIALLGLAACSSDSASIALSFPNQEAKDATAQIEILAFPRDRVGVGVVEITCDDFLGELAKGEPVPGDPVDEPFEQPFDGRSISTFPAGDPVVLVVGYNSKGDQKKPILEGCTDEFDTSGNSDDVPVNMAVIIPSNTRLVKTGGDRQAGHPGAELASKLKVLVDASLPGRRAERYPLPGIHVTFDPSDDSLKIGGGGAGATMDVITNADGNAEVPVLLPEDTGVWKIEVEAKELYESGDPDEQEERKKTAIATFQLSAISGIQAGSPEVLARVSEGTPVAIKLGNVVGDASPDIVVLSCSGSDEGCQLGRLAQKPYGTTKLAVFNDVLGGAAPALLPPMDFGVTPSGLFLGPLVPGNRDDIALVNSRKKDCVGGGCERSEILVLSSTLADGQIRLEGRYALTSSNAVGLAGWKEKETDNYLSLFTAGQGRSQNVRPCSQVTQCLAYHLSECDTDPASCGCPPNERCECPENKTCTDQHEPGVCVAQDKEIDSLINHYNSTSARGFENDDACLNPVLYCEKAGQNTRSDCSCLDNPRNLCTITDSCGCQIPNRIIIGAHGATQVPYGLAAGPLQEGETNFDVVAATVGGLDFIQNTSASFRWQGQPTINSPIHEILIANFDERDLDEINDVAWYTRGDPKRAGVKQRSACLTSVSQQCPIVRNPAVAEGEVDVGCLGLFLRKPESESIEAAKTDGCLRYSLEFRPDGMCSGDFNGDGTPDIAMGSSEIGHIPLFLGNGVGGVLFPPDRLELPSGLTGGPIACADVDDDGLTDILVVSRQTGEVILIPSRG
ncbi:MAG: VCBS repeat-containing protein [Deltaproteobacteria bacterium]|nr:VCBS repeat-containing protein [Deltaproteobacteria bacterium]